MNQTNRPLTVSEVAIQTATVAIKTITLGKKQMTLSVFRQLPNRHIIQVEPDGVEFSFRGEPWGLVNYFWNDCGYLVHGRPAEHLHVVWQGGNRLYRACVGIVRMRPSRWTRGEIDFCGDPEGVAIIGEGICDFDPINTGHWECPHWPKDSADSKQGWVDQWNDLHHQLDALDQLFIAV
jgi:hypothetical protein